VQRRAGEYYLQEEALLTESEEIEIFQQLSGLSPEELRRRGKEIQHRLDQIEETVQRDKLRLSRPGDPVEPEVVLAPEQWALQSAHEYIQREVPVPPELRLPREELLSHDASVKAQLDESRAQLEAHLNGLKELDGLEGEDIKLRQFFDRYFERRTTSRNFEREYAETQAVLRATTPPEAPEEILDPWAARQQDSSLQPSGPPTRTAAGGGGPTTAPGADSAVEQADAFVDGGQIAPGGIWVVDASLLQENSSPEDGVSPPDGSPFDSGPPGVSSPA
jgi:hypothetical protein